MIDNIEKIFKNRKVNKMGEYKKAAVMILLQEDNEKLNLIFELRAKTLKSQPGDICFPGGKIEKNESEKDAAIRETIEELNLQEEDIKYIGQMDEFVTPYRLIIYPFIAKTSIRAIEPSEFEVEKIIKIPLDELLKYEPKLYNMKIGPIDKNGFPFELINGGETYKFREGVIEQYFYTFEGYTIWGYTAYILKEFLDIIKSK
ncbi:NUDIX hydrolase [Clostridium senegalense]|uniref:NUDIX hydrolase n=1 Tax=Clostridium senegalense TaxID=1465809 RepID=UPI001C122D7A|nr:CoA pyrophosphatase [Clostridium senegalense]MBU5225165.1 CoA pyrophosphatase [Clostridium senegalense]